MYLLSRTGRACPPTTANATTCNRDSQQLTVVSINSTTDIHSDDRVCIVAPTLIYAGHALPSPLQLTQATDHPLTQPMRTNLPTHPANEDQPPHSPRQRGPTSPLTQLTRTNLPTHPANEDQPPHSPSQRGPTSQLTQPTRTSLPTHPANEGQPPHSPSQ